MADERADVGSEIEQIRLEEIKKKRKKGFHDPSERKRKKEISQAFHEIFATKDTRKFLEFMRRYGIRDGTEKFARLYELWISQIGRD